jgi:4-aminobutyrate aminotransferase
VIEDEGLVANARARGSQMLAGMHTIAAGHRSVGDVRGLGCMLAFEFVRPGEGDGRVPNPDVTKRVLAEALERKLIVLSAGTYANVVRIIPPLVTTAAEVDLALSVLGDSLEAAGA